MNGESFVEYVIKALVDSPDDVQMKLVEGEKSTVIELKVKEDDIGKVIGKNGRIIRAIRMILKAIGTKNGKRYLLDLTE